MAASRKIEEVRFLEAVAGKLGDEGIAELSPREHSEYFWGVNEFYNGCHFWPVFRGGQDNSSL